MHIPIRISNIRCAIRKSNFPMCKEPEYPVPFFSEKFLVSIFFLCGKNVFCTKPRPLPYSCLLFSWFFQSASIDCKLTSGAAGDKNFDKSPTKTRQPRKVDLRARYWAFLFDNLRRAVDEIYVTCESDQSVVECKVSLQLFSPCCRVALIPYKKDK